MESNSGVLEHEIVEKNLLGKMDKIVGLMEEEKSSKIPQNESPKIIQDSIDYSSAAKSVKPFSAEGIEKEIFQKKIVSDFDRLLELVKEKGTIKESDAIAFLGMKKERFDECCSVLEQSNLVKVEYPAFGDVILKDAGLVESKKKGA